MFRLVNVTILCFCIIHLLTGCSTSEEGTISEANDTSEVVICESSDRGYQYGDFVSYQDGFIMNKMDSYYGPSELVYYNIKTDTMETIYTTEKGIHEISLDGSQLIISIYEDVYPEAFVLGFEKLNLATNKIEILNLNEDYYDIKFRGSSVFGIQYDEDWDVDEGLSGSCYMILENDAVEIASRLKWLSCEESYVLFVSYEEPNVLYKYNIVQNQVQRFFENDDEIVSVYVPEDSDHILFDTEEGMFLHDFNTDKTQLIIENATFYELRTAFMVQHADRVYFCEQDAIRVLDFEILEVQTLVGNVDATAVWPFGDYLYYSLRRVEGIETRFDYYRVPQNGDGEPELL